jgi:hypothetical protein
MFPHVFPQNMRDGEFGFCPTGKFRPWICSGEAEEPLSN